MEKEEYRSMYELEGTHWWYAGLHDLLFSAIRGIFKERRDIRILDAGCGTGYVLKSLDKYGLPFGVDISETALGYCRQRGLSRIAGASVSRLPFADGSFDLVVSMDVLYHRQVEDDRTAIEEIRRVLADGGFLIADLPAYEFLKRRHDERVHTRRRYTKKDITRKLRDGRLDPVKVSYRNMFLFPAVLISALSSAGGKDAGSSLRRAAGPVNFALKNITKMENRIISRTGLPFGSSVFCIARKKAS
ncbi:class I SAM-dependent methyltransferase [Candidatus Omnitrophota bacterium]